MKQAEKDDVTRSLRTKIDELQAKITAFQANPNAQSPGNFDFKQKLIQSKNFAKVIKLNFLDVCKTQMSVSRFSLSTKLCKLI